MSADPRTAPTTTSTDIVDRPSAQPGPPRDLWHQLAPVRAARIDRARRDATTIVDDARRDAAAAVARAEAEAETALARARERAEATARARRERARARRRRLDHDARLSAEAEFVATARERVRRAVRDLPDDPRFPALLDRLVEVARAQLGDGAVVVRDPRRGVSAELDGRRVDYTLGALADRAFDAIAEEAVAAWER